MNYLEKNKLVKTEDLAGNMNEAYSLLYKIEENADSLEKRARQLSEKIKFSQNYVKYKNIAARAKKNCREVIF